LTRTVIFTDHVAMRALTGIVALLMICVIVGLAPLAYADPPDPTWIDGLWDSDDYESAVVMVLGTCAIVDVPLADAGPVWSAVAAVQVSEARATGAPLHETASPRAPPRSLSS
jgi:hypothetical protein